MDTQPKTLADLPSNRRVPLLPVLCFIAAVAFKGFQYLLQGPLGTVREFPVDRNIIAIFYIALGTAYLLAPKARVLCSRLLLVSVYLVPIWFLLRPVAANNLSYAYVIAYFTVFVGVLYFLVSPNQILAFTSIQVITWTVTLTVHADESDSVQVHLFGAVLLLIAALTYILRRSEQGLRTQLAEEGQYFKALFSESPDAQIILERDIIVDHNEELHRFLPEGTTCVGRSVIDLFLSVRSAPAPACESSFRAFLNSPTVAGRDRFACDFGFQVTPDEVRWGDILVKRLPLNPSRCLVTIRDTTERRLAVSRAEAAAKERAEFLSTMSHEIRTPLSGIIGLVRLLRDDSRNYHERTRDFETLETTSQVLMDLINGVLDLSKLKSGSVALSSESVNIRSLIDTVVQSFSPVAQTKGIAIAAEVDVPDDRFVLADRGRLLQVLANLLSNAVKVTTRGGVTLSARELSATGGEAVLALAVTDTGPGIPESEQQTIFNEYHHVSTGGETGTGLGLSIVRQILALYESNIEVDSELGRGSTFRFELRLPLGTPSEEEVTAPVRDLLMHVAIVEDDRVNRLVLRRTLERWGSTVREYGSAESALVGLETHPVDAVVLDLQLPGMDGLELSRRLREAGIVDGVPVVLLSAGIEACTEFEATAAGVTACLSKPFDDAELRRALSGLEGSPSQ